MVRAMPDKNELLDIEQQVEDLTSSLDEERQAELDRKVDAAEATFAQATATLESELQECEEVRVLVHARMAAGF